MIIKIDITQNAIREAHEYQARVLNTSIKYSPNYTNLSEKDRFAIGYLGEWAFNEYLLENDVDGHWNPKADGIPDEADFFLKGQKVDIKTGSNINYQLLMFPEAQFLKSKKDIYVGVILDLLHKVAYIHGYALKSTIQRLKPKDYGKNIPTLAIKLSSLKEISEII